MTGGAPHEPRSIVALGPAGYDLELVNNGVIQAVLGRLELSAPRDANDAVVGALQALCELAFAPRWRCTLADLARDPWDRETFDAPPLDFTAPEPGRLGFEIAARADSVRRERGASWALGLVDADWRRPWLRVPLPIGAQVPPGLFVVSADGYGPIPARVSPGEPLWGHPTLWFQPVEHEAATAFLINMSDPGCGEVRLMLGSSLFAPSSPMRPPPDVSTPSGLGLLDWWRAHRRVMDATLQRLEVLGWVPTTGWPPPAV